MSPWTLGPSGEITVVDFLKLSIYLRGKDTLMSESLKCNTESAKTSKEVDEPHYLHPRAE